MDGELRALDTLAEKLRELDDVGVAIATEARAEVEAAARATAAAGTAPDGSAWKPTKEGGKPLAGAAGAISAVVSGTTRAVITLILRGHYVVHHFGRKGAKKGTGLPAREILPDPRKGNVPQAITDAIRNAAQRVLARTVGGR